MLSVKNMKTKFICILPFSIRVPPGSYPVKLKQIAIISVKQIMKARIDGEEVDLEYDSKGVMSNSHITITFPWKIECVDEDEINSVKIEAIKYLNRFIEVYRHYSDDCGVTPICYSDIPNYVYQYLDDTNKIIEENPRHFDTGGMLYAPEYFSSNDMIKCLITNQNISFVKQLLLNSEKYLREENYRLSILEAVTALEVSITEFTINKFSTYKIPKDTLTDFVKKTGLTLQLKVLLNLYNEGAGKKISQSIVSEVISAITARNHIVHYAATNQKYSRKTVNKMLKNIKLLINHIDSME